MGAPAEAEDVDETLSFSTPPEQRAEVAALLRALEGLALRRSAPSTFTFVDADGRTLHVPDSVFVVLARVIEVLARGDAVTVVPVGRELTTQQAANLLNVSRQYLVRLLEEGRLPFHRTGTHRRVRLDDLLAFKARRDLDRDAALDALTTLSEEVGGYGELSEKKTS